MRAKTRWGEKQVLSATPQVRDRIVQLGKYRSNPSQHPVRLIEVQLRGVWYQYLTNVLDPKQLSVVEVVALYEQRWQMESAFLLVKRLLGLAYLWAGGYAGSAAAYFAEPENRDLLGIVKRKRKTLSRATQVALLMPQPT